jgi:hypothetical protein
MSRWKKVCLALPPLIGLFSVWGCGVQPATPPPIVESSMESDISGPDLFEDRTADCGVDFTYRNGEDCNPPHLAILESLGGGAAIIDYDNDGLLDLFFTGGGCYTGADKKQIAGNPCKLYRNLGGFRFRDVTREAALDALANGRPWFYTHGVAAADYDRDGYTDLLVTGWGRVALFHNVADGKGGRRFLDVSAAVGLDKGITWASSAAWGDLDGDGYPDLYVCQYVDWSFDNHPTCSYDGKTPDVCPPKQFNGLPHKVFRNDAGRRFLDVSAKAGLRPAGSDASKGLGVLIVDVNRDGKPDVYVANDAVDKFLYINHSTIGEIRFVEEAVLAGVARGPAGHADGSMGLDAADLDDNGRPWLWVTNYKSELHALYRNLSDDKRVSFFFHTTAAGIAAIGQQYVGWGTGFLDVDRDGWEDLFVANGHVLRNVPIETRRQMPVLLQNRKGKFSAITPRGGSYFRQPHLARGAAVGDLDNDGRIDLVVSHVNEPVAILRNVSPQANHWLGIALLGKDHADVAGARIILETPNRKQTRFAKGGGSYASSGDRRHVFGLGDDERIDRLTVVWPDGKPQVWKDLVAGRYYRLTQGKAKPDSLTD